MLTERQSGIATFLFTDIEGSTRMWEEDAARMHAALAAHDALAGRCIAGHAGHVVKSTGDGVHAVFDDPLAGIEAACDLQLALADPDATAGVALAVRCGLHAGANTRRDDDFFGTAVNRAARIMSVAHGGQILVSETVAALLRGRLPPGIDLLELGPVRLRDIARPEVLSQVIHPRLRATFPPLRSLAATPHNLPQALTSFVGREHELAAARTLLSSSRLLTLLGIGGLGKSRLALELARTVRDEYADGVWFVELAAIRDARLVPHAIAAAIGIKETAATPLDQALRAHLADRALLLVLDNCEHLTQACAQVARDVLEFSPDVRVVATSRERLNVRGEQVLRLDPLTAPKSVADIVPAELASYPAALLFRDRARALRPEFDFTAANAGKVADICRRLDGIPLALELAAARIGALPVEAIADRLADRFRLLRNGDRTALPRQQTLRALIDWSHDLLGARERTVFHRLAVFAGGFTLDAAEAITADDDIDRDDVVDIVAALVEKSLVTLDASEGRYLMLDTVREYADEQLQLAADDDSGRTRALHLAHYVSLAETARPELAGSAQAAWLARLDRELENILAGHRYAGLAPEGGALGLRLVSSLTFYWVYRGKFELGRRIASEALARPGAQTPDLARCRALFQAGQLDLLSGRYESAGEALRQSLAIARALDVHPAAAAVLQTLAVAETHRGQLALARDHLAESRSIAQTLADKRQLAVTINELGQLERLEGRFAEARASYEAALGLAQEVQDRESMAVALLNIAAIDLAAGDAARAMPLLAEARAIVADVGSRPTMQAMFATVAVLAAARDRMDSACRLFVAAESMASEAGLHAHPADAAFLDPAKRNARRWLGESGWREALLTPADVAGAMHEVELCLAPSQALPGRREASAPGEASDANSADPRTC